MNLNEIIIAWGELKELIPFDTYKSMYKRLNNNELVIKEYKEKFKIKRKK